MKKLLLLTVAALVSGGCCRYSHPEYAFNEAVKMVHENRAECVVVKDNAILAVERGRGVSPLLKLYDTKKELMAGATVVDKVIGRAAAFIVIKGKAKAVYGKIMSEDAKELLAQYDIKATHDLLVPRILNRKRDGLCPLEDSVKDAKDADSALKSMRKRIIELRSGK